MTTETALLTLAGYPLSIFASFTYEKVYEAIKKRKIEVSTLNNLFIKSFEKAIDIHNEHYDEYSKNILNKLKKEIKKDKNLLLDIMSSCEIELIELLKKCDRKEIQLRIAKEMIKRYKINEQSELIINIISDCFSYYQDAFFNNMSEKEGIQVIIKEVLKIDDLLELLRSISCNMITNQEFDRLRSIVISSHYQSDQHAKKTLEEYDKFLNGKYHEIELRGFSPKISGKEIIINLEEIFVKVGIAEENNNQINVFDEEEPLIKDDYIQYILRHRNAVILGDPGAGKSTLLKYLMMRIISLRKTNHPLSNIIPIFIRISDYADYFKKNKKNIYEFIIDNSPRQYVDIFKDSFECSNLILFMDGLDEITDTPLRIRVAEEVKNILSMYPYNRYIITSRIVGYQESRIGGKFKHFTLKPFTTPQIQEFANSWYKAIAKNTDRNYKYAKEQGNMLYNSISRNNSVLKLASNPLLMTIIAMIHFRGKKLPNRRVELYEISTETFLEYWVNLRLEDESQLKNKNEIIEIMSPIAFRMHETKSNAMIEENEFKKLFLETYMEIHTNISSDVAKADVKEFIDFLRKQAGFFCEIGYDEQGNKLYSFMHLTFQEYFAAIELVRLWSEEKLNFEKYIYDPRWTEILRLAAAQISTFKGIGRRQSSQFVNDIFKCEDSVPEISRKIQLVSLIFSDDINVQDTLTNNFFNKLIDIIKGDFFHCLVSRFDKVFEELFYSEYNDIFVDKLFENLKKGDMCIKNIICLLLKNSWNDKILEQLKVFLQTAEINELACVYQFSSITNIKLKNDEVYKINFEKYLETIYESKEKKELYFGEYFNLVAGLRNGYRLRECEDIVLKLNNINSTLIYDECINIFLERMCVNYMRQEQPIRDLDIVEKQLKETCTKFTKLRNILRDKQLNINSKSNYRSSCWFKTTEYFVLIKLFDSNEDLIIQLINKDFEEYKEYKFKMCEINNMLTQLKQSYDKDAYNKIKQHIYYIIKPLNDFKEDLKNFTKAYNDKFLYNFFEWEDFPIKFVHKHDILSNIILDNIDRYLNMHGGYFGIEPDGIDEISIDGEVDIIAPIKALILYNKKVKVDEQIVQEVREYLHNCPSNQKDAVIKILNKIVS